MIFDEELATAIQGELKRSEGMLSFVASENHASKTTIEIQGSMLTDRAIEGYPGRRYFPGCEWIDKIETLAIRRAIDLFGADHANVQPHSGTNANLAVYLACLNPGDTMLAMDLSHGGHLSHGTKVSITGKMYRRVAYGVDRQTETIDYDNIAELAEKERPKLIVAGGSAYPRFIDFKRLRSIADSVGALLHVDMAHFAGLVAGGAYPSPVPHAHFTTFTLYKTMRGGRGGVVLCQEPFAAAVDKAVFPGLQSAVLVPFVAAKAYAFKVAATDEFKAYARQTIANAQALASGLMARGARLVSNGTDSHLLLLDVTQFGITGAEAEQALYDGGIVCNRNRLPFDTSPAGVGSGVRFGTSAVTSRGLREDHMNDVAGLAFDVLAKVCPPEKMRERVAAICREYPLRVDRQDAGLL